MDDLGTTYKLAPIQDPAAECGGFTGYASVFHFLDYQNDIIAHGSYAADIPRFMEKGFIGGVEHDHKNPIGRPERLFEDERGLWMAARLVGTEKAQETRQLIREKVVQQLSVGILPIQVKRLATKAEVLDYWRKVGWQPDEEELARAEKGARLIKRAKLLEISPVALGANERTQIMSCKSAGDSPVDVLASLRSLEFRVAALEAALASEEEPSEDEGETEDDLTETLAGFRNFLGDS